MTQPQLKIHKTERTREEEINLLEMEVERYHQEGLNAFAVMKRKKIELLKLTIKPKYKKGDPVITKHGNGIVVKRRITLDGWKYDVLIKGYFKKEVRERNGSKIKRTKKSVGDMTFRNCYESSLKRQDKKNVLKGLDSQTLQLLHETKNG